MIKHIVFDFGGVILDLDGVHTGYPNDLAEIFNLPIEKTQKIWHEHKSSIMTGKESPKDFLIRMKSELKLKFDVEKSLAFWEKKNTISKDRIDWELIKMLEHLKKIYQIHMFTDQIKLDNGARIWINNINQHFHTIFRSYEQGFRKPFSEAYKNLLEKINAVNEANTVIFIDDNLKNIEAANKAGINGILYTFKKHNLLKKKFKEFDVTFFK